MNNISIQLSMDDLLFLCNAIGEAWEAVRGNESEFKSRTNVTYERANEIRCQLELTLRNIERPSTTIVDDQIVGKRFQLSISVEDLGFLCIATRMTLDGLERWEFHTRTGRTPEEAQALLNYLRMIVIDAGGDVP